MWTVTQCHQEGLNSNGCAEIPIGGVETVKVLKIASHAPKSGTMGVR